MGKYYAVRIGRKPGIYLSWEKCKEQTNKYPGAEYKSFTDIRKAEKYIKPTTDDSEEDDVSEVDINIINVFTDGACSNNGKKNASAGIGVYFSEDDPRNYSRKLSKKNKHTNNTAEIKAIIQAYKILENEIKSGDRVRIYSDSIYAMRAATEYGEKQEKIGWEKDIPNKNLVKKIYNLFKGKENVEFIYVKAHTGKDDWISKGNEGADNLAQSSIL